jgi:hypothetical protein
MTIRRFIGNAAASACLALAGGILTTQAGEAAKPPPVLSALPGDPDELINACRMDPLLARWAGRGPGKPLEEGQQVMLLDDDKVPIADRPHVPWAKPLAGGPIRIAVFGGANWHSLSDIAETALRLDCELFTVEISLPGFADLDVYGPATDPATGWLARKALKTLDRPLDVIILHSWCHALPADVMAKIDEKVKAGAGLIVADSGVLADTAKTKALFKHLSPFAGERKPRRIAVYPPSIAYPIPEAAIGAIPFAALPGWESDTAFRNYQDAPLKDGFRPLLTDSDVPVWIAGKVGQGRMAVINGTGVFPNPGLAPNQASYRYEEYGAAMMAKLIRWAAKREPSAAIEISTPQQPEAGKPFPLTIKTVGKGVKALDLEAVFRDFEFRTLSEKKARLDLGDTGEAMVTLAMPAVPAGERFVAGVIARDGAGRAVDWGQLVVEASAGETLEVKTDKEIYQPGETVAIAATLAGADPEKTYTADLRVFDATGRLLMRDAMPMAGGMLSASYTLDKIVSPEFAVQITVARDGQAARVGSARFFCPQFGWNDYMNGLWPHWWTSPYQFENAHRTLRDWAELDCTGFSWGGDPWVTARLGIRNYRVNDAAVPPADLYVDADKAAAVSKRYLDQAIAASARYGTILWNFQDERHASGEPQFSPKAIERFQAWLAKRHGGDIARLNQAWDRQLKDFSEAQPARAKELPSQPASIGAWMDTCLFIRDESLAIDSANAAAVRAALPAPQYVGIDGFGLGSSHHAYSGVDFGALLTGPFNTHCPYTSERLGEFQMFRALVPAESPMPAQGGEKDIPKWVYYARPWQQAMAGGAGGVIGLTRFIGSTFVHQYGCLFKQAAWFTEAERPLRHGLGKVLLDSRLEYDPVVILYSYPSLMTGAAAGAWLDPENKHLMRRPGAASLASLQAMLQDNGVLPGWVTDDQAARGNFKNARLLIIPDIFGMAISDATCAAIRRFVENGGTVMAMMSPALYDEKGRLREKGGLDDVFGVTRDKIEVGARPSDYLVNGARQSDPRLLLDGWFVAEFFEKGLKTAGGKALGEHIFLKEPAPAFVLNEFGKGKALLLNLLETQYHRRPYADAQKMMRAVLDMAGIQAPVTVTDAMGSYRWGYQCYRHQDGDNRYVGIYRLSDTPAFYSDESVVKLPAKAHVYQAGGILDAVSGVMQQPAYLGETAEAEVTLRGAGSVLLAALPYKIKAFDVVIPSSVRRGQNAVIRAEVKTAGAKPGRHVAHVELRNPTGLRHSVYCGNFVLQDGKGEFVIPFALNDLEGRWQVTVREAVTGLAEEDTIRVK